MVILAIKYHSIIKKEQLTDTFHNLEESHRYYTEWKKTDTKKECTLSFYIWSFRDGKLVLELIKKFPLVEGTEKEMRIDWEGARENFVNDGSILHID